MSKNQDPMARFVESCLQDEEIQKCTTNSEVFNVINRELQKAYKGRASVAHIAAVAEDAAESVCLCMNIPWTENVNA